MALVEGDRTAARKARVGADAILWGPCQLAISLEYLPAVARRLHHGRHLAEPFDFLTWFEFAPEDATRFDELVQRLRTTEEWSYVEREVDLRLARD